MQLADVPNESAPSQVASVEDQAVDKTLLGDTPLHTQCPTAGQLWRRPLPIVTSG